MPSNNMFSRRGAILVAATAAAALVASAAARPATISNSDDNGARARKAAPVLLAQPGNTCPEGYTIPSSKGACKTAFKAIKSELKRGSFKGTENDKTWPRGCYYCDGVKDCTNGVWFNSHSTGQVNGGARPICTSDGEGGDGAPPSPFGEVLFVGDSDIEYWKTAGDFPGAKNVGVGGWTCKKVLSKLSSLVPTTNPPRWVVLVCGENDLDGGSADKTFGNFEKIVGQLTARGIRTLYMGTKPEPDTKPLHKKYRQYDGLISAHANKLAAASTSGQPPLVFIDVYKGFETLGNGGSLYRNDQLHLSTAGYSHWTRWAKQALAATGTDADCTRWESDTCEAHSADGGGEKPTEKTCDSFKCNPSTKVESVANASSTVCKKGEKNTCTRAQCCAKIQRFCSSVKCKGNFQLVEGAGSKKCHGKGQPKCTKAGCCERK